MLGLYTREPMICKTHGFFQKSIQNIKIEILKSTESIAPNYFGTPTLLVDADYLPHASRSGSPGTCVSGSSGCSSAADPH